MGRSGFKVGIAAGAFVALTMVLLFSLPLIGLTSPSSNHYPAVATSTVSAQTNTLSTTTSFVSYPFSTSSPSNQSATTEEFAVTSSSAINAIVAATPYAGFSGSLYSYAQGNAGEASPSSLSLLSAKPIQSDAAVLAPLAAAAIVGVAVYEIAARRDKEG